MSFSNSDILYAYNFTSIWEVTLIIASGVALRKLLNPSSSQFLNFRMGLIPVPTSLDVQCGGILVLFTDTQFSSHFGHSGVTLLGFLVVGWDHVTKSSQ